MQIRLDDVAIIKIFKSFKNPVVFGQRSATEIIEITINSSIFFKGNFKSTAVSND